MVSYCFNQITNAQNLVVEIDAKIIPEASGANLHNGFIIVNGNRNREVHLPDQPPTDKVNGSDFGTADDNSVVAQGRYYKTVNNLPWALNITGKFSYPVEKAAINTAYLKFNDWAVSSGVSYPDWYQKNTGYRQQSVIYSH